MIMTTKTSIPNELLSTKEQSQKSYDYPKYTVSKELWTSKQQSQRLRKILSEEICIIMGGSPGAKPSMGRSQLV